MDITQQIKQKLQDRGFLEHEKFVRDVLDGNEENQKMFDKGIKIVGSRKRFYDLVYELAYISDPDESFKAALTPEEYEIIKNLAGLYRSWLDGQWLAHDEMYPDDTNLDMIAEHIRKRRKLHKLRKQNEQK